MPHRCTGTHVPYGITQYYLPPGRRDIPAKTKNRAIVHCTPYTARLVSVPEVVYRTGDATSTIQRC